VTLFPLRLFLILPLELMSLSSILFLFYKNEAYVKQTFDRLSNFSTTKRIEEQNAHYHFYLQRYQSKSRAELKAIVDHQEMSAAAKQAAKDLLVEEE
ncbi:MAG: hypothetical protein AAGJ93_08230, partial [Bacteroidota bacterium]